MEYSELQYTTALDKIRRMKKRIRIVQGGSSSAKTFSILIDELNYSLTHPHKITSVITDSYPNLRVGAIRDFLRICDETNASELGIWNKTDHTFTLPNGSIIEFYSVDTMGALGSRRDRLFVNEANRITYDTFTQLEIRTKEQITIDFNPISEFYAHTELMKRPDADFVKLTYKDNKALDQNIIDALEARIGDGTSNWAKVYIFGEVGSLEGNIYSGWREMSAEDIKNQGKLVRYGLDFGFGHPTGMVSIYENEDGSLGIIEEIYEQGINSSEYPRVLKEHGIDPSVLIVADAARPEIISDIKAAGFRIIAANKDSGSVMRGISRVQERTIYYFGKNLNKEFYSYAWRKKRSTGETIYEPEKSEDDLMDALRYAIDDLSRKRIEF